MSEKRVITRCRCRDWKITYQFDSKYQDWHIVSITNDDGIDISEYDYIYCNEQHSRDKCVYLEWVEMDYPF